MHITSTQDCLSYRSKTSPIPEDSRDISILATRPSTLLNVFSFLSPDSREKARSVCKSWKNLIFHPSPPTINLSPILLDGYGDFILLNKNGYKVSEATFKKVFKHLNDYLPQVSGIAIPNRLQALNKTLEKVDPTLRAIFIPRALYELSYLLCALMEEMDLSSKKTIGCSGEKICWHSYRFSDWTDAHNLDPIVVELAFRLNRAIIENLKITPKGLTEKQCKKAVRAIFEKFQEMQEKYDKLTMDTSGDSLILDRFKRGMIPDPSNVEKAMCLECQPNTIVLYRGSRHSREPLKEGHNPYSICFGTSLFAGVLKDPNACAGVRMFYDGETVRSYAIPLCLESGWQDAFFVPPVNTLCELTGGGEKFHARFKCLRLLPGKSKIASYAGDDTDNPEVIERLVSSLSPSTLEKQLNYYQDCEVVFIPVPGQKKGWS